MPSRIEKARQYQHARKRCTPDSPQRFYTIGIPVAGNGPSTKRNGLPRQPVDQNSSAAGYFPVPFRFEVCGLLLALSVAFNVPVLEPVAVGLKTTLILQLALAARLAVQVVVETLKSPVVEMAMLPRATDWLLVSVNVLAGLVVPTACFA